MVSSSRIGIGILSFAHGHANLYAEVLQADEDVRLVSGWDDDPERGRECCASFDIPYAPHLEDVLDNANVHAVIVTCETSRHAELAVAAAKAGKHILCQKPMALTLDDCDRMSEAADKAGVMLSMAFQMRHDPVNQRIRDLVRSGTVGRVAVARRRHCIGVLLVDDFVNGRTRWHLEAEKNMGMFMDDAVHAADWFHWIFGPPVSVIAEIDNLVTEVAPDDNGVAVYRFRNGEMGILFNSSTVLAGENTTEIYGDRGVLVQNYGDGPSCAVPRCPDGPPLKSFTYGEDDWQTYEFPIPESQADRIRAVPRPFVEALLKETDPPASARDGRIATEMMLGAYRSAQEGKRIRFPLDA